jgi:hypothetical protein
MDALNAQTLEYLKTRKQFGARDRHDSRCSSTAWPTCSSPPAEARSMACWRDPRDPSDRRGRRTRSRPPRRSSGVARATWASRRCSLTTAGWAFVDELAQSHYFRRLTATTRPSATRITHLALFSDLMVQGAEGNVKRPRRSRTGRVDG